MSSDIVKRLREKINTTCNEAADRIEALEGEISAIVRLADERQTKADARAERLEGELRRYKELFDGSVKNYDPLQRAYIDRAVAAEARAERLRVALTNIQLMTYCDASGERCVSCIARKALEDDKPAIRAAAGGNSD
jgi:hypothetical protein